ncbi:pyridoxal phosphate-dependent aminotransferase [Candidatus Riflebacteria bacterium]
MRYSERVENLKPSATLALFSRVQEMQEQGEDIISFCTGEPDFFTPDPIKRSGIQAIQQNKSFYSPISGISPLKAVICSKFAEENSISFEKDEIIISNGAKQILFNALAALINPGDEVIIITPYWVSYPNIVKFFEGIPVLVKCDRDFYPDTEEFKRKLSQKTRCIILCSPNNPAGCVYPRTLLSELIEIIQDKDIFLISDEIYEHLIFTDDLHYSPASYSEVMKNKTLTINGLSKTFAMTGWRIGYAGGPKKWIKAMEKIQGQSTSGPNTIAQYAAIEAISQSLKHTGVCERLHQMLKSYQRRCEMVVAEVQKTPGLQVHTPQATFYALINAEGLIAKLHEKGEIHDNTDAALSEWLLKKARVATVPGVAFGIPGYLRVSFSVSDKLISYGFSRIRDNIAYFF